LSARHEESEVEQLLDALAGAIGPTHVTEH